MASKRRVVLIVIGVLAATVAVYAAASYPSSVKSFSTKLAGATISAAHVNDLQDEVVAVENALLNGFAHALKPSSAGGQDLGTSGVPWGNVFANGLKLTDATTLTLATDTATVTRSYHALDTESAAATDDCATLTAGTGVAAGFVLVVRAANVARVVTMKDGTGNLLLSGDYALSSTDRTMTLIYDGTNWRELARSAGTTTMTTLKTGSGTSTAAGATNLDTIAITGLTANDVIEVVYTIESATQLTANPVLYSTTDSLQLAALTGGNNLVSGSQASGVVLLSQRQSGNTALRTMNNGLRAAGTSTGPTIDSDLANVGLTTAWTGSWTLALRHNGVTAGGTFSYVWAVYKRAGQ